MHFSCVYEMMPGILKIGNYIPFSFRWRMTLCLMTVSNIVLRFHRGKQLHGEFVQEELLSKNHQPCRLTILKSFSLSPSRDEINILVNRKLVSNEICYHDSPLQRWAVSTKIYAFNETSEMFLILYICAIFVTMIELKQMINDDW